MEKRKNFAIVSCQDSFNTNTVYNLYYAKSSEFKEDEDIKYIGLYKHGVVRAIGEVSKIAEGVFSEKNLNVIVGNHLTDSEEKRIWDAIRVGDIIFNCAIEKESHKFFLVKSYVPTYYKKVSNGPLRQLEYKDICEVLNTSNLESIVDIAEKLKNEIW